MHSCGLSCISYLCARAAKIPIKIGFVCRMQQHTFAIFVLGVVSVFLSCSTSTASVISCPPNNLEVAPNLRQLCYAIEQAISEVQNNQAECKSGLRLGVRFYNSTQLLFVSYRSLRRKKCPRASGEEEAGCRPRFLEIRATTWILNIKGFQ